jgi:hypothetical protein
MTQPTFALAWRLYGSQQQRPLQGGQRHQKPGSHGIERLHKCLLSRAVYSTQWTAHRQGAIAHGIFMIIVDRTSASQKRHLCRLYGTRRSNDNAARTGRLLRHLPRRQQQVPGIHDVVIKQRLLLPGALNDNPRRHHLCGRGRLLKARLPSSRCRLPWLRRSLCVLRAWVPVTGCCHRRTPTSRRILLLWLPLGSRILHGLLDVCLAPVRLVPHIVCSSRRWCVRRVLLLRRLVPVIRSAASPLARVLGSVALGGWLLGDRGVTVGVLRGMGLRLCQVGGRLCICRGLLARWWRLRGSSRRFTGKWRGPIHPAICTATAIGQSALRLSDVATMLCKSRVVVPGPCSS